MYTIGNIIYGCPITEKMHEHMESLEEPLEWEDMGFTTMYSGSADIIPGYIGVKLKEFTEFDHVKADTLLINPTDEQRAEVERKVADLREDIRALLPELSVWIVWSTS